MAQKEYKTKYGYFSDDGKEYVITRPDTPMPWVNVICPNEYGVIISQTGGGYSWLKHAQLNRITHWRQDLLRDSDGKYLFIQDLDNKKIWSITWQPVKRKYELYRCIHGIGHTKFINKTLGIKTELKIFVPPKDKLEVWQVKIKNETGKRKKIKLFSFVEWCLGTALSVEQRELYKLFGEITVTKQREILATKRVWAIPNEKGQFFNKSWDYIAYHCGDPPPSGFIINRKDFLGKYRSLENPMIENAQKFQNKTIKDAWNEKIASLIWNVELMPDECKEFEILIGVEKKPSSIRAVKKKYLKKTEHYFNETQIYWKTLFNKTFINTPDKGLNYLMNHWLKYQAISGRIRGRTGYYQPGGAFGFRDQLQDSQIFLKLAPEKTKERILIHASKQYRDGAVLHWWDPIIEQGMRLKISDNLLWLPFIVANYIKETGDFGILGEEAKYLDGGKSSILTHCEKAIEFVWQRRSKRGLPLIGEGDWNDGLSTVGWDGKGESVWLGHFLYGILVSWQQLYEILNRRKKANVFRIRAKKIKAAINKFGWDGNWYVRAFCDDGKPIGSKKCSYGKIFLNAQTWAIINDIAPPDRVAKILKSLEKYLYRKYGPLLLYPAYKKCDPKIGYLTRYAPGTRENGGLYFHAVCWALIAEAKLKREKMVETLLGKILPPNRSKEAEVYSAEPFVIPGNIDGPDSPNFGRGGWSWYTGSATWLFTVIWDWIIGFKVTYNGIKFEPCLPKKWRTISGYRFCRGIKINFLIKNVKAKKAQLFINGKKVNSNFIEFKKLKGTREISATLLQPFMK